MSNTHNTVYEFDVNLICNFFLLTERQGPGSPEVTKRALSFIDIHKGNKAAEIFVEYLHTEEALYRKYKEYYGYVFYIGKKI